jgi:hypothetical protein
MDVTLTESTTSTWLDDRTAQLLLESRIPARVAWLAPEGGPRVAPMWFTWAGDQQAFVVSAFGGARKLRGLRLDDPVGLSIDSDDFPYRSLNVRGRVVSVDECPGVTPEYRLAAARYLGPRNAERWLAHLGPDCRQVRIAIATDHVTVADLARDARFLAE